MHESYVYMLVDIYQSEMNDGLAKLIVKIT